MDEERLVRVFLTQSWIEAEIVKGRLEAEGISVHLQGVHDGPYPLGPVELFVTSGDETRARSVLEQAESGSYEIADESEADRSDR